MRELATAIISLSAGGRERVLRRRLLSAGARLDGRRDPIQRLLDTPAADGLAQVVERVELECLDRGGVIGAHEHDLRRGGEPPEHAAELESVEIGHPHVEEDRVVALARGLDERIVAVERALDLLHHRRAAQQPREVLELAALVVDGEDREPIGAHAALVSPLRFGTVITAVVPSPGCDSTRRA